MFQPNKQRFPPPYCGKIFIIAMAAQPKGFAVVVQPVNWLPGGHCYSKKKCCTRKTCKTNQL
jgi:hypothetical protein